MTDASRSRLRTARLDLVPASVGLARAIVAGDLSAIRAGVGWPHADNLEALRLLAESDVADEETACWLVVTRATGEVIGELGWMGGPDAVGSVEIGYGLAAPWRRRGFGTEAVGALVQWALGQPNCGRLTARVLADNLPSRRLLEQLDFTVDAMELPYVRYERGERRPH